MAGIAMDTANCGIQLFSVYNYSENYDFRNSYVSKAAVTLLLVTSPLFVTPIS
ncbi:MAG: hypothetical protein IKG17_04415 [Mogibacterium sp.]|nr:hypothetical protein [Mogibacterium sp.]